LGFDFGKAVGSVKEQLRLIKLVMEMAGDQRKEYRTRAEINLRFWLDSCVAWGTSDNKDLDYSCGLG
jgi:hypothetical protein